MMPQTLSKALRALATAESISAEVEVATAARGFAVAASSTSNALAPGRSLNEPSMNAPTRDASPTAHRPHYPCLRLPRQPGTSGPYGLQAVHSDSRGLPVREATCKEANWPCHFLQVLIS